MLELLAKFADEKMLVLRDALAGQVCPFAKKLKLTFALLRLFLLEWLWPAPLPPTEGPAALVSPQLEPLDYFARVAAIVADAIVSFERIEVWQQAASEHIDAAEYAFRRMLGELATAMPLPVDGAPLRGILADAARITPPSKKALAA
jgi:hypothetical protein